MSDAGIDREAVPIPVKTPDANLRLSKWLHQQCGAPQAEPAQKSNPQPEEANDDR
jgi:hypothetical protein